METLLMKSRWRDLFAARSLRLVLVLGSFAGWRRDHLDRLRDVLRRRDYVPVVIDLENRVGRKLREGRYRQSRAHREIYDCRFSREP